MRTSPTIRRGIIAAALLLTFAYGCADGGAPEATSATGDAGVATSDSYDDLLTLFDEWRGFVRPDFTDGVADYGAPAMAAQYAALPAWQSRLSAIDPSGWPPAGAGWLLVDGGRPRREDGYA